MRRTRRTPARPDRITVGAASKKDLFYSGLAGILGSSRIFARRFVDAVIGTDPGRAENVGGRRRVHEFQHPPSRHPRYTCMCTPPAYDSRHIAGARRGNEDSNTQGITIEALSSRLGIARLADRISSLAKRTSSANAPHFSSSRSRRIARSNRRSNRRIDAKEKRACRASL